MVNNYVKTIESNYNLRASILFDGDTYEKTLLKDLKLINQFSISSSPLLDVGCGSGWHLEYLYKSGYTDLTGIDVSELSLKDFRARLDTGDITLIKGDFFNYNVSQKFDCIINFHSCLGQFGSTGDGTFIQKLFSVLREKGYLILTVFTKSKIHHLLGNFEVKYSKRSDMTVHSALMFNAETSNLKILQTFSGKLLQENIRLYDEAEIVVLLTEGGFNQVDVIQDHSDYCSVFVGQKHI
ncbi:class I SAM-dependent methyltransferase [Candidatus Micrarchaeota archaeon]|nr:class I SAM-dependent methyltransferase [Candidatus Micrarchaeota archaeon]